MEYKFQYQKRFSYPKTLAFWNLLESMLSKLSENTYDYATIIRDRAIFELSYSYGLSIQEIINLLISNVNFSSSESDSEFDGTIYVNDSNNYRLVYPFFDCASDQLKFYIDIYNVFFKTHMNKNLFVTLNGNPITISYLSKRLELYNSKMTLNQRIPSLHTFRQFYISDVLRNKKITNDSINNQIGNNIAYNDLYYSKLLFNLQ